MKLTECHRKHSISKQAGFIGLDIGNTRLSAGVALANGKLVHTEEQATPARGGAGATIRLLIEMTVRACRAAQEQGLEPSGIGLGFGGPVDYARQMTRQSFHAAGWDQVRLAEVFEDHFHIPSLLDNDANAGGLAEALFGAARGSSVSLYVNVGTGIGGAVIIGTNIHHGATGSAGEIGHTVVDPQGPKCNCGRRGCVEAVASGSAIARAARAAGIRSPSSAGQITTPEVMEAARRGDQVCTRIVRHAATSLGVAIANAVNLLDPEVVVLGGGVPEAGEVWLVPLQEGFEQHVILPPGKAPPLVGAALGYRAGVFGAAALGMKAFRAKGGKCSQ